MALKDLWKCEPRPDLSYDVVKPQLKAKDGKVHTILITKEEKNVSSEYFRPFSDMLEDIISGMQDDGYEIVDIKPSMAYGPIIGGNSSDLVFSSIILYK